MQTRVSWNPYTGTRTRTCVYVNAPLCLSVESSPVEEVIIHSFIYFTPIIYTEHRNTKNTVRLG